jgi:hypothetical protein
MGVLYVRSGGSWLPLTGIGNGITQPQADALYVNIPGDTMTGQLTINRGPAQLCLAIVGNQSYIGFYDNAGQGRHGYLQGSSTGLYMFNDVGQLVLDNANGSGGEVQLKCGSAILHVVGDNSGVSGAPKIQVDKRFDALAMHTWGTLPDNPEFGLTCDNGGIQTGHSFQSTRGLGDWTNASFKNYQQTQQAGISLHVPGVAPILGVHQAHGEKLRCLNNPNTAWCPIQASSFETNSTITSKRDVRPLRDRERIVVRHPVESDTVPLPDVMALRPVAFRPKVPAMRIVPTNGEYETIDPNDPTTWSSEPDDGVLGHEGNRERLGLIAEEVQYVIPSAVCHDRDGNATGIDYAQITVALLDHVQRMTDEIATLRYRVAELEGQS